MRVLILGARGFIGRHLTAALQARGDAVRAASLRDPYGAASHATGCDAVVNLAGAPIAQRWSPRVKREIEESRTQLPRKFLDALGGITARPRAYISASAIGFYGTSETQTFVESSPAGHDFLARVCARWEDVAWTARALRMRVACVRTALALGSDDGVLARLLPPFRAGLGGPLGNGKQWFSWAHVDDVVGLYLMALDGVEGVLNAASPHPVTNAEFAKTLGDVLHRPSVVPVPTFALKAMFGEGARAMLEGQRVLPERTLAMGYTFEHPTLREALTSLIARR